MCVDRVMGVKQQKNEADLFTKAPPRYHLKVQNVSTFFKIPSPPP
jgi:hypothetical protein